MKEFSKTLGQDNDKKWTSNGPWDVHGSSQVAGSNLQLCPNTWAAGLPVTTQLVGVLKLAWWLSWWLFPKMGVLQIIQNSIRLLKTMVTWGSPHFKTPICWHAFAQIHGSKSP